MPSEDATDVETLLTRLDSNNPGTQRAAASALSRWAIAGEWIQKGEIDETIITRLAQHLDTPDARVRGHVIGTLCIAIRRYGDAGVNLEAYGPVVDQLLQHLTADEWWIRSSVLAWDFITPLAFTIAEDDAEMSDGIADLHSRLAVELIDRLHDPIAVVRKRAGEGLAGSPYTNPFGHAAGLVLGHPDPETAVTALIEALSDPVDDVGTSAGGRSPRHTAGSILSALGTHRPTWLQPHADALWAALDIPDAAVQTDLLEAIAPLLQHTPQAVAPFCTTCITLVTGEADTYEQRRRVAAIADRPLSVAPATSMQIVATLTSSLGDPKAAVRMTAAITAGRVAQVTPDAAPEVFHALSIADSMADEQPSPGNVDADPLVILAPEFPEFVAERLCDCCDRLFGRENQFATKGRGALLRAVADANPQAARPVVSRLKRYCTSPDADVRQGACWTLGQAVVAAPKLGIPSVPDLLDSSAGTPPLRSGLSRAIESLVAVDVEAVEPAVPALVETLGMPVDDDRDLTRAAHLYAARALAAFAEKHPNRVPDLAQAFVEPWRSGAFDGNKTLGMRDTGTTNPLLVLGAATPAVAADRFASLFRAVGSESPIGDPADFRLAFTGTDPEIAGPATRALLLLFDHDEAVVRTRALREVCVAAKHTSALAERLAEPLAAQLSNVDEDRASEIVDSLYYVTKYTDRPAAIAPAIPALLQFVQQGGDQFWIAQIIKAVAAVDPETVRAAAADCGGSDVFPPLIAEELPPAKE